MMRRHTRIARCALVSLCVGAVATAAAAGGKRTKEERAELHARIAAEDAAWEGTRAEKVALAASVDPNTCVGRDHPARAPGICLETAATYDGLPDCENLYYKATINFGGITERECLAGLETDWGQYRGCRECFWRSDNRKYLCEIRRHTDTCCDECEKQNDCADESVECDAFLRCKAACLKKRDAVFDPARIRRHHNWAAEKSKYEGRDACAIFSRTCTSKPMQGMLWMSFLSVAAVQIWHFYGSRFGTSWWQNFAFLFTAVLAAIELARWFKDFPITDVEMAGIALACYTLLCVLGLIGIYLTTPPAAIDGDSDCKFGAALADALAYAEDPGRAEALSRILEDCIGSESEDDDE